MSSGFLPPNPQQPFFAPNQVWQPFQPFGALNFLNRFGVLGQIGQTAVMSFFPQTGFASFYNEPNILTAVQRQAFDWSHQMYLAQMAEWDRRRMMDVLRGIAALSGQNFAALEPHFNRVAGLMAQLPLQTQIQAYNLFTGGRSEMALAARLHLLGRFLQDPVTGFQGISAPSSMAIAHRLAQHFFDDSPYLDRSRGFTSDQLADIYFELARRGLGVRQRPFQSRVVEAFNALGQRPGGGFLQQDIIEETLQQARREFEEENRRRGLENYRTLSPEQIQALERLREQLRSGNLSPGAIQRLSLNPRLQAEMRSQFADRIARRIGAYTDVLAEMRNLFGEAGQPDAPISQLVEHLEQLAGGNIQTIDPQRLRMLIGQLREAARTANLGIEAIASIHQETAQLVEQMRLPREAALNITTGATQFLAAAARVGGPSGPVFGGLTLNEQTAVTSRRLAAGTQSVLANRVGMVLRLAAIAGDQAPAELRRLAERLRAGEVSAEELQQLALSSEGQFLGYLADRSGMSLDMLQAMARQEARNRAMAVSQADLNPIILRAQDLEMRRRMEHQTSISIRQAVGPGVLSEDRIRAMTSALSAVFARSATMSDEELRSEVQEVVGTFVTDPMQARTVTEMVLGGAMEYVQSRRLAPAVQQAFTGEARIRAMQGLAVRSRIMQRLEELLPGNLREGFQGRLVRLAEALSAAGVDPRNRAQLGQIVGSVLGMVPREEAERALQNVLAQLDAEIERAEGALAKGDMADPERRQTEMTLRELNQLREQMGFSLRVIRGELPQLAPQELAAPRALLEPGAAEALRPIQAGLRASLEGELHRRGLPRQLAHEIAMRASESVAGFGEADVRDEKAFEKALGRAVAESVREMGTDAETRQQLERYKKALEPLDEIAKASREELARRPEGVNYMGVLRGTLPAKVLRTEYRRFDEKGAPVGGPLTESEAQQLIDQGMHSATGQGAPSGAASAQAAGSIQMSNVAIYINGQLLVSGGSATAVSGGSRGSVPVAGVG